MKNAKTGSFVILIHTSANDSEEKECYVQKELSFVRTDISVGLLTGLQLQIVSKSLLSLMA